MLRNQLQHMQGPAIEHAVRDLVAKLRAQGFTQKIICQMFGVSQSTVSRVSRGAFSPKMIRNIQEKVAALSVEEAEREIYTGMDNLFFEKAYVHMIDILKRFRSILLDAGTEEITTEEALNPKELFYTKKVNLMAMIAFLNGCHEAVASEHKSEIPTDISQIIYQGDLRTPRAAVSQLLDTSNNITAQSNNVTTQNKRTTVTSQPQNMSPEEYLLGLIEVQNKDTLLALSDDEFNSRVKSVNSIKIRGKIRDIRTDYLFQLKKQQEEEKAIKRAEEREEQLDRFYATMQIKKIYKHPDGSILGCEIIDPEGLL